MELYIAKGTVGIAVHIALEEIGASYTPVWVDFAAGEQRETGYLAVNPKGRVPALQTDRGILTETAAILDYLGATFPEAGLIPSDPWEAARMREMFLYLAATVHVSHAHKTRGARWSDDAASWPSMRAKVAQNMAEGMADIEGRFRSGPWVLGETYSAADPYLYTVARWAPYDGVPLDPYPRLSEHQERMMERPAVKSAMAHHM